VAKENVSLDMSMVDIDRITGRAVNVQAMRIFESTYEQQLLL
jgi:hypothetical protein